MPTAYYGFDSSRGYQAEGIKLQRLERIVQDVDTALNERGLIVRKSVKERTDLGNYRRFRIRNSVEVGQVLNPLVNIRKPQFLGRIATLPELSYISDIDSRVDPGLIIWLPGPHEKPKLTYNEDEAAPTPDISIPSFGDSSRAIVDGSAILEYDQTGQDPEFSELLMDAADELLKRAGFYNFSEYRTSGPEAGLPLAHVPPHLIR